MVSFSSSVINLEIARNLSSANVYTNSTALISYLMETLDDASYR